MYHRPQRHIKQLERQNAVYRERETDAWMCFCGWQRDTYPGSLALSCNLFPQRLDPQHVPNMRVVFSHLRPITSFALCAGMDVRHDGDDRVSVRVRKEQDTETNVCARVAGGIRSSVAAYQKTCLPGESSGMALHTGRRMLRFFV